MGGLLYLIGNVFLINQLLGDLVLPFILSIFSFLSTKDNCPYIHSRLFFFSKDLSQGYINIISIPCPFHVFFTTDILYGLQTAQM